MVRETIEQLIGTDKNKSLKHRIDALESKLDFRRTFNTTIISAFTFVAGLFWRDVANSLIETFLPKWAGFFGLLFTAMLVTVIFVYIAVRANKTVKVVEKELESLKLEEEKANAALVAEAEKAAAEALVAEEEKAAEQPLPVEGENAVPADEKKPEKPA